jgi:hypothetical protein
MSMDHHTIQKDLSYPEKEPRGVPSRSGQDMREVETEIEAQHSTSSKQRCQHAAHRTSCIEKHSATLQQYTLDSHRAACSKQHQHVHISICSGMSAAVIQGAQPAWVCMGR